MKTVRKVVAFLIALTALPVPPSYSTRALQPWAKNNDPQLIYNQALEVGTRKNENTH